MANVASPAGGLVGSSNYNLYCIGDGGKPQALTGLSVEIEVTEEMVAVPSAPSIAGEQSNGIGFQLNCCPVDGPYPQLWQQYCIILSRNAEYLGWQINNWPSHSANWIIDNSGELMTIPAPALPGYACIPVGYRFVIELFMDEEARVYGVTFEVWEGAKNLVRKTIDMKYPGFLDVNNRQVTEDELGQVADVMLVIVGYGGGAATLLASGKGSIRFQAKNIDGLSVGNVFPSQVAGGGTAETSNVTYGVLKSGPAQIVLQSFDHTSPLACVAAQGYRNRVYSYLQGFGGTWTAEELNDAEGADEAFTDSPPGIAFAPAAVAIWIAFRGLDNSLGFSWQQLGSAVWNSTPPVYAAGNAFSSPSIANIGDTVCIAVQGPHNCLNFCWAELGSPQLHYEQVADQGTTFSAPSLAWIDNAACIAARGPDNSLLFYRQVIGAHGPWGPGESVPDAKTKQAFSAPSLAQVGDTACIAVQGTGGEVEFYWQEIGSAVWNSGTVPLAYSTVAAPSIAQVGDSVCIAAQGPNNTLWFFWQKIGFESGWKAQRVPNVNTSPAFSAPSIAQVGNVTWIAVKGAKATIECYAQAIGAKNWDHATIPNAYAYSGPVLAGVGPPPWE